MSASNKPITVDPAKLPSLPAIITKDVPIPLYFVGNKLTPTAIAIWQHEPKHINSKKLMMIHLNSVKTFSVMHATIEIVSQTPNEKRKN